MKKHWLLLIAVSVVFLSTTAVFAEGKSFEGVNIAILIHPTLYNSTGGNEGQIAAFEKKTGARVTVVKAPIGEIKEKMFMEFMVKSDRYDVMTTQTSEENADLFQYAEPLDTYLDKTGDDYDKKDLIPSLVNASRYKGKLYGIPCRYGTNMLYYRTDLMKAAGLDVPKNWQEFTTAAQKLTTTGPSGNTINGILLRGKGEELVYDWLGVFYSKGGNLLTSDWKKSSVDSKAGIASAQLLADYLKKGYLPADFLAWGRDDYITAMQQGRGAMGIYVSSYWGNFINPNTSKVADKMGWALVPSDHGVAKGRSRSGGWYYTMNKFSKNKEAAWALIEWLTNKENQLEGALKFDNGAIRASVYRNPSYLAKFPLAEDWLESIANSTTDPAHPNMPQIIDALNTELSMIIQGKKTAADGMQDVAKKINKQL